MARTVMKRGGVYETHARLEGKALEVRGLDAYYRERGGLFRGGGLRRGDAAYTQVLHGLSFDVGAGEIVGLCGESGCGKSTLSKAICGIIPDFRGEILLADERPLMVFQDPFGSLNPAKRVGWLLEEPLRADRARHWDADERAERIAEVAEQVELDAGLFDRFPAELSGGMRQRVMIAAAIVSAPQVLIADEPTTALDVTIQAQIIDLLRRINRERGTAIVFISHDLSLVRQLCHEVLVLRRGEVVEAGEADELFRNPQHAYTRALIDAIPQVVL
jgi:peptide/nickel transport system ATP-binding protein